MGYSPWGHKELDMTERLSLSLRDFKTITRFEQPPARGEGERCVCQKYDCFLVPVVHWGRLETVHERDEDRKVLKRKTPEKAHGQQYNVVACGAASTRGVPR